ncbi:DUF4190 domain-containing protein [Kineococcus sp. SYSU DK018]|uniref:DUF4190 domain-containing protein n=1 Tax=Kineococcus sp. SYSU DK018 TaxID=3383139 RepID=UPI003D7D518B
MSTPGDDQYGQQPGYGSQQGGQYGGQYGGNQYGGQYGGYQDQPYGAKPRNGAGLASLILGIVGLLLCWLFGIGLLPGLIGLVLGVVGLRRAKRGEATNKGVAVAGIVTSVLAVIAGAVFLALTIALGNFIADNSADLRACLEQAGGDVAAEQACQQQFTDDLADQLGG